MLNIKEIFETFDAVNAYTFSTIDNGYPEVRIAHFLTYDKEGLYFQTMKVKPFYRQLTQTNKLAVCSLVTNQGAVSHDENGLPIFEPGYFIRANGDVKELSFEELTKKAEEDERFLPLIKDIERYPTMTTFVLYRFKGEVYDYDFDKVHRDHKIERNRFSYGDVKCEPPGFVIDPEKCIACGSCEKVCTFSTIIPGEKYSIDGNRCDECGSCYSVCPVNAIKAKTPMDETYRKICGKKMTEYAKNHKN
ncbi:4Fe-4S binding protein [Clostridium sp. cel8]|uniref:4Fe-4S binding protein n=1 Tax=Clostridium sp. cel8 TaxID=2663123 RepID=UPI0015F4BF0B|nr:4Fe-4S binding protein [Clostridium sp. cel8]MBA5851532.1 4Fe-4S binding protein [Clostridium sp. cel8]